MADWPRAYIGVHALKWLDGVMGDPKLDPGAKASAYALARHMRGTGDDAGLSYPSHATVAALLNITPRSIQNHTAALIARGHLTVAGRGGNQAVKYRCVALADRNVASGPDSRLDRKATAGPSLSWTGNAAQLDRKPGVDGPETAGKSEVELSGMSALKSLNKNDLDRKPGVSEHRRTVGKNTARSAAPQAPPPQLATASVESFPIVPTPGDAPSPRAPEARIAASHDDFDGLDAGPSGPTERLPFTDDRVPDTAAAETAAWLADMNATP